jgi:hypothetical protein
MFSFGVLLFSLAAASSAIPSELCIATILPLTGNRAPAPPNCCLLQIIDPHFSSSSIAVHVLQGPTRWTATAVRAAGCSTNQLRSHACLLAALTAIQLALKELNAPGGPLPSTTIRIIEDLKSIDTHEYVQLSVRQALQDSLFRTCANGECRCSRCVLGRAHSRSAGSPGTSPLALIGPLDDFSTGPVASAAAAQGLAHISPAARDPELSNLIKSEPSLCIELCCSSYAA